MALMAWLSHPLRRAFFAMAILLLASLPVFAWMRYATPYCGRVHPLVLDCDTYPATGPLLHDGAGYYVFWQWGLPPQAYWLLGLALLVVAAVVERAFALRSRRSR